MNATIGYCALICLTTALVVIAFVAPNFTSDANTFLAEFVNHEFLNILGVILAITLASSAQIHLTLNGIEERVGEDNLFVKTRAGLAQSVHWLLGLFLLAFLLVAIKPLVANSAFAQCLFNGASIVVVVWNVLILVSLTQAVFGIKPVHSGNDQAG